MSSDEESDYDWGDFVVVRAKVNGIDRYECIPSTWLVFDGDSSSHTTVTFQFPSSEKFGTGIKFTKNQPPNKNWPDYIGKMLLDTDSQDEAFQFIEKARVKNSSSSIGASESDSEEESPPKRSGTKRKQSDEQNKNIQAKSRKHADAVDEIVEPDKSDSAQQIQSQCSNFYELFNTSYQQSMSNLNNTADNLRKLISTYKEKLSSAVSPTNQEYDDTLDDAKWTLRYPEPKPGTKELMPNTHVYVCEEDLNECQIKYTTPTTFTKGLLKLVFTDEAIRMCTFTGRAPTRQESEDLPVRPGLDLQARETFVTYVEKYCIEKGWLDAQNAYKTITFCARSKLSEEYQKSKKPPKIRSVSHVFW